MVITNLDFIHGDHLLKTSDTPAFDRAYALKIPDVMERYPQAAKIELTSQWINQQWRPVFAVDVQPKILLDAKTLEPIALRQSDIVAIAEQRVSAERNVQQVTLLGADDPLPSEIPSAIAPIWQVTFAGVTRPTFYLHPNTGEIVTQRHNYWRLFDFAWMLHIMDYENRVDVQNNGLKAFVIGNIILFVTGLVLVIATLRPRCLKENNS